MDTRFECEQMDVNKTALAQLPSKESKTNMDTSALPFRTTDTYRKEIITAEPSNMRHSI